jgi:hypothetical protein
MSVITQTAPSHVAAFSASGYKRLFSSLSSIAVDEPTAAPALRVPAVQPPAEPFQTQPFSQTNARVPMARACLPQLRAGSVAFVSRGMGPKAKGAMEVCPTAPNIHVIGMEELNGMLAQPHNFVEVNGNDVMSAFYVSATAASVFKPTLKNAKISNTLTSAKIMRRVRNIVKDKYTHPLVQYTLDGIVATRPEADSGILVAEGAGGSSGAVCNVAVAGPAALKVKLVKQDPLKMMRAATSCVEPDQETTPDNYYVKPLHMTAVMYVVLVAQKVAKDGAKSKWMFQYNLVSSTHLSDTNRLAKTRFLDEIATEVGGVNGVNSPNVAKLILRVDRLGVVTDSNFVKTQKEVIVSVGIRRVEATERAVERLTTSDGNTVNVPFTRPLSVFQTFNSRVKPKRMQERVLLVQRRERGRPAKTPRGTRFQARKFSFATGESGSGSLTKEDLKNAVEAGQANIISKLDEVLKRVNAPNTERVQVRVAQLLTAWREELQKIEEQFVPNLATATENDLDSFKSEVAKKNFAATQRPAMLSDKEEEAAVNSANQIFVQFVEQSEISKLTAAIAAHEQIVLEASSKQDQLQAEVQVLQNELQRRTQLLHDLNNTELPEEDREKARQELFSIVQEQLEEDYEPFVVSSSNALQGADI